MELRVTDQPLLEYIPATSLTVISSGHVVSIAFADILHIATSGIHVIIQTASKAYKVSYSLQDLLRELPVNDFFRVSRSRIVCRPLLNKVLITGYYKVIAIKKLRLILDQHFYFYA